MKEPNQQEEQITDSENKGKWRLTLMCSIKFILEVQTMKIRSDLTNHYCLKL
jgi:hypothetical protein